MAEETQDELRAMLKAIGMKRHGKTWKIRMAEDMRCSRSTITLWDQGERNIKGFAADKLKCMAKLSGIKKSDINAILSVDNAN